MKKILFILLSGLILSSTVCAQPKLRKMSNDRNSTGTVSNDMDSDISGMDEQRGSNRLSWGRDSVDSKGEKEIPIGLFQWKVDPILGNVIEAENNDTVTHLYNSFNNTDGYNGEYTYLGNLASPRLSRIYMHRDADVSPFLFTSPLSFAHGSLRQLLFTNTLSPITNLSYHTCGSNPYGQERVRAYFASNINKISGFGFKLDYLYGRGYYNSAQCSNFNADLFGYYRGEKYEMHAWVGADHEKNAENGGIEDDEYIHNPQSFPQKYGTKDIPVMLTDVYNRNDNQNVHLSHRYNMGYYRELPVPDSLKPKMPLDAELLLGIKDSLKNVLATDSIHKAHVLDSLRNKWLSGIVTPTEFIPVSSFIHTLNVALLKHFHYEGTQNPSDYYTYNYYGNNDKLKDVVKGMRIRNTVGIAMREGFKKWVKMGITAYAAHELETYRMPYLATPDSVGRMKDTEQHFMVGGEISKRQGEFLRYTVNGEIELAGADIGDFNIEGTGNVRIPLGKRDTINVDAHAFIKNLTPDYFQQHYHSRSTWWDTELSPEFRTRIEGTLSNQRSKSSINVAVENVKNYAFLATDKTLLEGKTASLNNTDYSHNILSRQHSGNIQVFSATLKQDLSLGIFNWENEVTYQTSSNQDILPLPALNIYSNMYLKFMIAKVLRVEIGGDVRFFTNYYAPDYAPSIGQFVVQDKDEPRMQCGNYPIVNAYLNLHLKHCRLYMAGNHVNAGHGRMFLSPHYPINPRTVHFGLSWNFFN